MSLISNNKTESFEAIEAVNSAVRRLSKSIRIRVRARMMSKRIELARARDKSELGRMFRTCSNLETIAMARTSQKETAAAAIEVLVRMEALNAHVIARASLRMARMAILV